MGKLVDMTNFFKVIDRLKALDDEKLLNVAIIIAKQQNIAWEFDSDDSLLIEVIALRRVLQERKSTG